MSTFEGPTPERLIRSDGNLTIGDDKQGSKTYTFKDSSLERIYANLKIQHGELTREMHIEKAGLSKFYEVYIQANLCGSIGSIDPNRSYTPSSSGRTFLAATERQQHARDQYRAARSRFSHHEDIVVSNVVCADWSLEIAGYAIGKQSQRRAISSARELLRSAGMKLGQFFGYVRS